MGCNTQHSKSLFRKSLFWEPCWGRNENLTFLAYCEVLVRSKLRKFSVETDPIVFIGAVDRKILKEATLRNILACASLEEQHRYVNTIIHNACLDIIKGLPYRKGYVLYKLADTVNLPEIHPIQGGDIQNTLSRSELNELLTTILQSLPDKQRTVIQLLYDEGLTRWDIAKRMGKHRNTISKYVAEAHQRIRKALGEHGIRCRTDIL